MAEVDKNYRRLWANAVSQDRRITPGERLVLTRVATYYVTFGCDTFKVRQITIAQKCGVDVKTVKRAFDKARAHGYLVLHEPRRRGPGGHGGNGYRLVIPGAELGDNLSPNSPIIGGQDSHNWGTICPELGDTAEASTCGNDVPIGSLEGSLGGSGVAAATAAPPPRPGPLDPNQKYCPQHDAEGGRWDTCEDCKDSYRAWKRRNEADTDQKRTAAEHRRRLIDACCWCDHNGKREIHEDLVEDCDHVTPPAARKGA